MFPIFTDCNDAPNVLYLVFIISLRCVGVVELSAFSCMSLTKILVVIRPDIYIALNSTLTVNLATIFIILVTVIDCSLRIKLYLIDDCALDGLLYSIFREDLCGTLDRNDNNSIINVSEIDQKSSCPSYPVISVMIIIILVLEFLKFVVTFMKIMITLSKKFNIMNTKSTNDNENNAEVNEIVDKNADLTTVQARSDIEFNTEKKEENPVGIKTNPKPLQIQVMSCATPDDRIEENSTETVSDIETSNEEIVQDFGQNNIGSVSMLKILNKNDYFNGNWLFLGLKKLKHLQVYNLKKNINYLYNQFTQPRVNLEGEGGT